MFSGNNKKNIIFFLLWLIVTGASWSLIIYPGLKLRNMNVVSWDMIFPITVKFALYGAQLGIIVSVFQYLVLKTYTKISWAWSIYSALGYILGAPISFLAVTMTFSLIYPTVLTANGTSFLMMPLNFIMLLNGLILGFFQIPLLGKNKRHIEISLLVLSSSLAWGLGFWASAYRWGKGWWSMNLQSGAGGILIGIITGGIIIILLHKKQSSP